MADKASEKLTREDQIDLPMDISHLMKLKKPDTPNDDCNTDTATPSPAKNFSFHNSSFASDEANSRYNFNFTFCDSDIPTFTPDEIGVELKLDRNVVEFLKNEPFDDSDPSLVILNFQTAFINLGPFDTSKLAVYNALIRTGAQQISENVFKFQTWEALYASHFAMKHEYPWAFYSEDAGHSVRGHAISNVPTIQTTILTWFSEQKLSIHPFPFFRC